MATDVFENEVLDGKILDSLKELHVLLVLQVLEVDLDDRVGMVHRLPDELIAYFDLLLLAAETAPFLNLLACVHVELE